MSASKSIPRTLVGTNTVPNITHGVPLSTVFHFPEGAAYQLGGRLFDTVGKYDLKILEGKAAAYSALNLEVGLAGPNWAGRLEVEGSANEDQIHADLLLDDIKAGILIGAIINPILRLQIQAYTVTEHHRYWPPKLWFTRTWRDVFNIDQDIELEPITWAYKLIPLVKTIGGFIPFLNVLAAFIPTGEPKLVDAKSGIVDYVSDPDSVLDWAWEGMLLEPQYQAEWDLIELARALAGTIALIPPVTAGAEAVSLLERVTSWLRPSLGTGPVMGILLQSHLKISGLSGYYGAAREHEITTHKLRTEGSVIVGDIVAGAEHVGEMTGIGLNFTQRASLNFSFGWHIKVSWLKILSYDLVETWSGSDFHLEIPVSEQYRYALANELGNLSDDDKLDIKLLDSWFFGHG